MFSNHGFNTFLTLYVWKVATIEPRYITSAERQKQRVVYLSDIPIILNIKKNDIPPVNYLFLCAHQWHRSKLWRRKSEISHFFTFTIIRNTNFSLFSKMFVFVVFIFHIILEHTSARISEIQKNGKSPLNYDSFFSDLVLPI